MATPTPCVSYYEQNPPSHAREPVTKFVINGSNFNINTAQDLPKQTGLLIAISTMIAI
jgi:hypothetical protein